jgi:hypothetical protein
MDNHDSTQASARPKPGVSRSCYSRPQLTLLGDVRTLTESGSMLALEDSWQNGACSFPNMWGNMC